MGILSNPLSPLAPYAQAIKLGLLAIVGIALLALLWSWHDRGRQIETLEATQTSIVEAATLATVEPDSNGRRTRLKPAQVPAAIAALSSSLQSADAALQAISARTVTAKAASDLADKALDRDLDTLRSDFEKTDLDSWDPWKREN